MTAAGACQHSARWTWICDSLICSNQLREILFQPHRKLMRSYRRVLGQRLQLFQQVKSCGIFTLKDLPPAQDGIALDVQPASVAFLVSQSGARSNNSVRSRASAAQVLLFKLNPARDPIQTTKAKQTTNQ